MSDEQEASEEAPKSAGVRHMGGRSSGRTSCCCLFESLDEVRDAAWEWLLEYNEERPHDSLDDMTPLEYRRKYESQRAGVSTN